MRKKMNEAGSIGIIGGADGPTAVFVAKSPAGGQWQKALTSCKMEAEPRAAHVTGEALAQHLKEQYGAYEVPVSRGKRMALKMSMLMNHHSEVLAQPPMPPQNAGLKAWREWAEQSHMDMQAASDIPDELYGLKYLFLAVPRNGKTERFYTEAEREQELQRKRFCQRLFVKKAPPVRAKKMVFGIELSTGYCQLDDGCQTLMDEVTLWRGVTREDIQNETPEFMAYAAAMRGGEDAVSRKG
jgi:hypothetical protein